MGIRKHVLTLCLAALATIGAPAYSFDTVLPDFSGDQDKYGFMQTRITNAMLEGPNFAEHYTLLTVGCGTQCAIGFVADNKTGEVYDFPYGGEENSQMQLEYGLNANQILVSFKSVSTTDGGGDLCVAKRLLFQDGVFVVMESTQYAITYMFCPSANALFTAD